MKSLVVSFLIAGYLFASAIGSKAPSVSGNTINCEQQVLGHVLGGSEPHEFCSQTDLPTDLIHGSLTTAGHLCPIDGYEVYLGHRRPGGKQ